MLKLIIPLFFTLKLFGCSEDVSDINEDNSSKSAIYTSEHYVGSQKCADCHNEEYKAWHNSHHDLAMQQATEESVVGDFNNTSFNYFGTVSKFYKKDNQFYVQTDGPDGKLTDYPIAYTFGVYPLQQYLIKFPKGRYQALNIVWDTRSKHQGGQRWFHLYPDEHIKYDDELHWTGINQNWNFMCADCHSTNLIKNYDLKADAYNTNWSEIDVACEACHGPASRHMEWAKTKKTEAIKNKGFKITFNERKDIQWNIDTVSGNAKRSQGKDTEVEVNMCAQCHSRRLTIKPGAKPESKFLDHFQPALLTEGLYHVDGQIDGEVYVYGSFIQSKMFHAGVSCSDCHEPHSLKLRADGNDLCAKCHMTLKYDSADHHMHKTETAGSQCVSCHMPAKIYMGVDARRDHSFRVPRPDLTLELDVPNTCNQCHKDKTAKWAVDILKQKYGTKNKEHYAKAIHAGRNSLASAPQLLTKIINDDSQPAIARATAVNLLTPYLSRETAPLFQLAANDEQPLVGLGVALSLESIPEQRRMPFAYPLLYDISLSTRMLAGRALMGGASQNIPLQAAEKLKIANKDYEKSQLFNTDRPESLVNLARYYLQQGNHNKAEKFYQDAISIAPYFTPAHINLSDLYRQKKNPVESEKVLRNALLQVRDKTPVQHAIGLHLIRQKKTSEAMKFLQHAAESSTTTSRYVYVYAIALHSSGEKIESIEILEKANDKYPGNIDIMQALISINREMGNKHKVKYYEDKLYQ